MIGQGIWERVNEGDSEGKEQRGMAAAEGESRCGKEKAYDYSKGSLQHSLSRKTEQPLLQPFHQTHTFPSEKSSFARLYHPPQGLTTEHCSPALPMLIYTAR